MIAAMEEVNKKTAAMERTNTENDAPELFLGSMDVKSLYPSLQAQTTAEIVSEISKEVDIKIEGVNWAEAGKYLAINLSQKEIKDLKIEHLVSTRKNKGGRHPGITTAEVMGKLYKEDGAEDASLFHPPKKKPTQQEKKIILSQVIKTAILAILRLNALLSMEPGNETPGRRRTHRTGDRWSLGQTSYDLVGQKVQEEDL